MCAGRDLQRLCESIAGIQVRKEGSIVCLRPRNGVPEYRPNIYTTDAIVDPYPHYARLRQLGPVCGCPRHRVYALPSYTECKAILRDDKTFVSGNGVALNRLTNRLSRGTTLNSDGAEHDQRRKLVAHRLLPRALRAIDDSVEEQAARVVDTALATRRSRRRRGSGVRAADGSGARSRSAGPAISETTS